MHCGDGILDEGEECDDGNDVPGDGCESDCTFTCETASQAVDCDDGHVCTEDSCDEGSHTCSNLPLPVYTLCRSAAHECDVEEVCDGAGQDCPDDALRPDGHVCRADPRQICLSGACAPSVCGDGYVDVGGGEFCEPGPDDPACLDTCTYTCVSNTDCMEVPPDPCNGEEFCDLTSHTCSRGDPLADGDVCNADPRRICLASACTDSVCGDGWLDAVRGEECDDGNIIAGDGCEPVSCLYSCHADADCADPLICNGAEVCGDITSSGRVCEAGVPPDPGTPCESDGLGCTVDECDASHTCASTVDPAFCLIGGVCRTGGEIDAANTCRACDPASTLTEWTILPDGQGCDDGAACTFGDACSSGSCAGMIYTCTPSICETGSDCDGAGGCLPTYAPPGAGCDDGDMCTARDACDGSGACAGTPVRVSTVAAGGNHTCILLSSGGVRCWGSNDRGQLGDGTTTGRGVPRDVAGLASGVSAVAGGLDHTCAVVGAGGVKCWGANGSGQLGDGTAADRSTPVDVSGLGSGVVTLAGGVDHTCALLDSGGVKCWGANESGQLGDGTTVGKSIPADVSGLASGVSAITAGGSFTCALLATGGVKCWGRNDLGQLGDGTGLQRDTPVDVSGLSSGTTAVSVSSGGHACALLSTGGVLCWGRNDFGQLGDGSTIGRLSPVNVLGLFSGVAAILTGGGHSCAALSAGGMRCWGLNLDGQLGDGTTIGSPIPVFVSNLPAGAPAVAGGAAHTCALLGTGGVRCWGDNAYGQLGDETAVDRPLPADVAELPSQVAAADGSYGTTCVLTSSGGVKCWGVNHLGQLGDGTTTDRPYPVDAAGLSNGVSFISVSGYWHACAVLETGGLKCWGDNATGQLGDGTMTSRPAPVDVTGLTSGISAVAAGTGFSCALLSSGGVKCWGINNAGQLGDGTTVGKRTPVDVSGLTSGVSAIAAKGDHVCALLSTGGVKCWGSNSNGQLGDGTTVSRSTPVDVLGLASGVSAIASGGFHTCALLAAGGVNCWGRNDNGQLGDGTTNDRSTPVDVLGLPLPVSAIDSGRHHNCALLISGGVMCWGLNTYGQLGDGTVVRKTAAVDVTGLTAGASVVATGGHHSCAVLCLGGMVCWGWNTYGQLGDGTTTTRLVPMEVTGL